MTPPEGTIGWFDMVVIATVLAGWGWIARKALRDCLAQWRERLTTWRGM